MLTIMTAIPPPNGVKPQTGSPAERIVRFRNKAEELRIMAEDWVSNEGETLLRIARMYDKFAHNLEAVARI